MISHLGFLPISDTENVKSWHRNWTLSYWKTIPRQQYRWAYPWTNVSTVAPTSGQFVQNYIAVREGPVNSTSFISMQLMAWRLNEQWYQQLWDRLILPERFIRIVWSYSITCKTSLSYVIFLWDSFILLQAIHVLFDVCRTSNRHTDLLGSHDNSAEGTYHWMNHRSLVYWHSWSTIDKWINNCIHCILFDVITCACPNVFVILVNWPLILRHGWLLTSHRILWNVITHPCLHFDQFIRKWGPMHVHSAFSDLRFTTDTVFFLVFFSF